MSSIATEPHPTESAEPIPSETAPQESSLPDAGSLHDRTPDWFRSSAASAFLMFLLGVLFVLLCSRRLWHTDLWDHVNYGNQILASGSVPSQEPLLALSSGMPMVNTAWLSQVGMAALLKSGGLAAVQFVSALLIAAAAGTITFHVRRRSESVAFGIVAAAVYLMLNHQQFLALTANMLVRPQLAGVLLFCVTLAIGLRRRFSVYHIGIMPLLFAFWANLHGSWAVGLLTLGLCTAGAFLNLLLHRKLTWHAAFRSHRFISLLLITQLCAAAVLLNPWGVRIYSAVLQVGSNPNIATMFEWDPLTVRMKQGQAAAVGAVLLLLIIRTSPRRLRVEEVLLLIAFGAMTCWSSRMINWLAPIAAVVIGLHGAAAWRRWLHKSRSLAAPERNGLWTVLTLGICWICFALTPLGVRSVRGQQIEDERLVSRQTPVRLAEFLSSAEDLPPGIVYTPAEWSGYLMHHCGSRIRPMVNLHVHVIPNQIWMDHLRLTQGPSDWDGLLDRYGINLVVADKHANKRLADAVLMSGDWDLLYQDAWCYVMQRRKLIE